MHVGMDGWRAHRYVVVLGTVAVAAYMMSSAPTVLWGDDAELQRIAITGEARVVGQSSVASHLLWQAVALWFVRVTTWFPVDAAGRVTLVSALAASASLLPVAAAIRVVGLRAGLGTVALGVAAVTGTVAFGLSHTLWLLASRPDAYTVQVALLALAMWACVRAGATARPAAWWAGATVLVIAALANHVMILASVPGLMVLATAGIGVDARRIARFGFMMVAMVVVAAGVGAYAGFPVQELAASVLSYQPYMPSVRDIGLVPLFLAYQFPLALAMAWWGWIACRRAGARTAAGLALLYAGVVGLMLFRYHPGMYVRDQFIFYLPSYLPVAVLIGLGAGELVDHPPKWLRLQGRALVGTVIALACAPVVVYALAATVAGPIATRLAPARALPGRDPVTYYLWPPKTGYTGARDYVNAAFGALPPGAVVLADWLPYQPMRYVQAVEGARPDVRLEMINAGDGRQIAFLKSQPAGTPLFLADVSPPPYYEIDAIRACFEVEGAGVVYRLTRKAEC